MRRGKLNLFEFLIAVFAAVVGLPLAAQAGPPLICHPFDIGGAKSLPWMGGDRQSGRDWRGVDPNYDLGLLVEDTLALLTPETPVIVRMETLRRAAVYSVWAMRDLEVRFPVKDDKTARKLLARLLARSHDAEAKGRPDALALFDAGYLAECYKQAGLENVLDGYSLVQKAIGHRADDPEMELAAALITMEGSRKDVQGHAQKARAGAKTDSLLAKNLASHFGGSGTEGETIDNLLTRMTTPGNSGRR